MYGFSGRRFGRGLVLVSMFVGKTVDVSGQEYIREFYPYQRETEAYAPMLQTDTTLFYRAVQTAPDLYGECTEYNLPQVAVGRRGHGYADRRILLNGMPIENYRTRSLLRILGADEQSHTGAATVAGYSGVAEEIRTLQFDDTIRPRSYYTALSLSDRNYRVGLRAGWSGALGKDWYGSAAVDARTGRDLHIEGVFTDALTAGVRFAKRFSDGRRQLAISLIVPLSIRGGRSASTEEAFRLTGDRLYNPAWGFQNGKVRNSRVRREQMPMTQITWHSTISESTVLTATASLEAGSRSYSGLNWYDARTPLPDNYRYLPSYPDDRATEEAWRNNDTRFTQIDWNRMIVCNRMAGGRAVYTLEEQVERLVRTHACLRFTTRAEKRLQVDYGVEWQYRNARRFKRMRDLLGAEYVVDIDQYLVDDDTYGNLLQNNLRNPDRRIGEGDRFGYDYSLCENEIRAFAQVAWQSDRFRAGAAAGFGSAFRYRRGNYEKELFAGENSYGRSRRMTFAPWSLRAYAGWSVSTRNYLEIAAMAAAEAPDAEDLFYQPLYNNRTVDAPRTEKHFAADVTWRTTGKHIDWQASAFATMTRDAGYTTRYYDDLAGVYSDMAVAGTGTCTFGIETAIRIWFGRRWQLTAAGTAQQGLYTRNPTVTVISDVDNAVIDAEAVSYMGNCRPAGVPRWTATVGTSYFGPKGWGFRLSGGYVGGRYVEPSPLRRTQRIARQAGTTPEAFAALVEQERLDDALTLDAALFKSFRLGEEARMTVTLLARNLTDDASMYDGYESPRIRRRYAGDIAYREPHATRYTAVYPRSFYLSVSCRF